MSKRKSLCVDEKVSLIRAIEKGDKITDVGKRFGFSRSTVATIWKNKDKYLQAELDGKTVKKLKRPKYEELDRAMLSWFQMQRRNNIPISGPDMKAKADMIAVEHGLTEFKASEGWLGRFKQRHRIKFYKCNDETRDVENATYDRVRDTRNRQDDGHSDSDDDNTADTNTVDESDASIPEQKPSPDELQCFLTNNRTLSSPQASTAIRISRRTQNNLELLQPKKQTDQALSIQNTASREQQDDSEDECSLFGKLIAKKMRKLPDDRKDLMMMKINQLFYEEHNELNNVHSST